MMSQQREATLVEDEHEPKVGRVVFVGNDLNCEVVGWSGCKYSSYAVDIVSGKV